MKSTFAFLTAMALVTPAAAQITNAPTVNSSITITAGNTFQTVFPAIGSPPAIRRSVTIQNNNASDSCWIFVGSGAATKANSILLTSGQAYTRYYPYVPSDAIQGTSWLKWKPRPIVTPRSGRARASVANITPIVVHLRTRGACRVSAARQ